MTPKQLMSYVIAFVAALVSMWVAFEYLRMVPSIQLAYQHEGITPSSGARFCFVASHYGLGYLFLVICTAMLVKEQLIANIMRKVTISGIAIALAVIVILLTGAALPSPGQ